MIRPSRKITSSAKQAAGLDAGQVIRWKSWHRWTAICLLAYIYLAVAAAFQRTRDEDADMDAGLIPVTIPELLRQLRGTVIPDPAATGPTARLVATGAAATSTAPGKPTSAGRPTPRRCLITTIYNCRCAGINRHEGGDERALRRRASDPRRPRVMRCVL